MNKFLPVLLLSATAFTSANAATLLFEDFEDATVTYTTSTPEFTDGFGDFFTRTDGSNIGAFVNYNNIQGSSYFAAMDINGEGASSQQTISFLGVNIAGQTDLSFSAYFAEDDDGSNEDWDLSDFAHIDYQIDGNGYQNLIWFENDGVGTGSGFNSAPLQDTNFDGTGDGVELTDTFALFTAAITGTGSVLDLRITLDLDSGDEDFAIDDLSITGTAVPLPAAVWMMGAGLFGLLGFSRRGKLQAK